MYRFFFHYGHFSLFFLGVGRGGRSAFFSLWDLPLKTWSQKELWPHQLSHPRSDLFLTLLFCHFPPTRQPGTRHVNKLNKFWHPSPQQPPTLWSLDISPAWYPSHFQAGIQEFYNPAPRTFLHVTRELLTSDKNNYVLEPRPYALRKQAISSRYVCVVVLKHSLRGNWPRDQYQIEF